jgi:ketosteroid isomerase-like protein
MGNLMRITTFIVSLLFATALHAAVATPAEEKEVLAAMNAFAEAVAKRDVAALQKLMHDELVYSHSDTRAQTKADLIKEAQEGRRPGGIALAEPKVHIYGNTAIVRGRVGGGARGVQTNSPHAVAVWIKGPAGWQVVARTATRPVDPAAAATRGSRSNQ